MANDDKKLLDEAVRLLTDIALNQSGLTTVAHLTRATEFVAKARTATRDEVKHAA